MRTYFALCAHVQAKHPRGGGGAPLHGLYSYVRPQRVGCFSRFGHEYGIHFS